MVSISRSMIQDIWGHRSDVGEKFGLNSTVFTSTFVVGMLGGKVTLKLFDQQAWVAIMAVYLSQARGVLTYMYVSAYCIRSRPAENRTPLPVEV